MRNLFILRGAPGSGKSTWIKENNLEPYTLSTDTIRLMYQSPITTPEGDLCISQNHDTAVWRLLFELLERRMDNGEMIIIDATHYKSSLISRYRDLVSKYRYRVNVVDFSTVPMETCLERNKNRDSYKYVPEDVIEKMYACLHDDTEVKKSYKVLTPEEAIKMINSPLEPFDANEYEKIVIFGDIHGCYDPLKEYFDKNPFNENYNYIFCGDYTDRGPQNKEVLEFLISLRDKKNCVFLEGNHECVHKDTDILTDKGWVNIAKLVNSHNEMNCKPYSYNISKDLIEVDTIKAFHKKHQDTMVCIETNNTKQVVSKNHEVLLGKEKVLAKDILAFNSDKIASIQHLIRPTSQCKHEAIDFSDDMLSLITWVVCDGTLVDAHKNKPEYAPKIRVQFKLSRLDKIQCLENLLNKMNITYTKKEATKGKNNKLQPYLIRIYSDMARKLYDIFGGVKVFPESFRNLDEHQLDVVLNSILSTDGSKQEQRTFWYTNNQKNIDIIQEACVKNGYAFSVRSENKSGFKKDSHSYVCCITKHWDFVKNKNRVSEIPYDDYSYCITTENGTLITRIDGKVVITGNCWLRKYSQKDYDMDYYENRPIEYKDPFVAKLIAQLKDRQVTLEKKINKNKNTSEELSKLLREGWETDPENREVFYRFEKINVPEKQKELHKEIQECEYRLEKLIRLITVLQHEEHNTKDFIQNCKDWFKETFSTDLSLDITNILEKNYNMESNRKQNPIRSLEFIKRTYPQIKDIDKTEIRRFCDRLAQMSYFTFNGHSYLVTHGGVPCMPTIKTATNELIKGVGKYEDHDKIDKQFNENEEKNKTWTVQIHGHRNVMRVPVVSNENMTFNLEGQVEFGGHLRVLELGDFPEGHWNIVEIKNEMYDIPEVKEEEEKSDIELLKEMYDSKWVQVKNLKDNVISFNFTRDAFEKDKWNTITTKARGLFVDKTDGHIVGRSFDKFFNYHQHETTEPAYMKEHIAWPLIGYKKENGFLGIVSKDVNGVHFFTKSSDEGDYVNWFIGVLCDNYGIMDMYSGGTKTVQTTFTRSYTDAYMELLRVQALKNTEISTKFSIFDSWEEEIQYIENHLEGMRKQLKAKLSPLLEEGYSYVFECVDTVNDPHIIKYKENKVVLLEVFKNQLKEEHVSWKELHEIADRLVVPCKSQELRFNNWEEFEEWKDKFRQGATQWDCKHEGYVFEDQNGYRVKFKSSFYNFWKQMRAVKDVLAGGRTNKKVYKTKEEIQVVKLMEELGRDKLKEMSIIDVEDMFYERYGK